ncbi:MAG TPA: glycosyltransferase family 4 protein, partial [Mollicutes bacterium]|nr:glycosyltransferase family 4 protein [Mollicutes bacterium]
SKTLEYMASGTPLLTTKLKGIPKEYYDYIYLFEDEDIEEMAIKIKSILLYNQEELDRFGSNARKFVFKEKNHKIQTKAIIDFIYKEIRK